MALVAVTGANGFIAAEIINALLQKGYRVRGTVRSKDPKKLDFLQKIPNADKALELVEADLTAGVEPFEIAFKGCQIVFHSAAPCAMTAPDPQRDLIDPMMKGVHNVLEAVSRNKDTVKRVVYTSSAATIVRFADIGTKLEDRVYDEKDWNQTSTITDPYRYGKRLSEEAAWEWSQKSGIELVTILPTVVIGRLLNSQMPELNLSQAIIFQFVNGSLAKIPPAGTQFVDVEDVAKAHILAAELPHCKGNRYICTAGGSTFLDVCSMLHELYPEYSIPTEVDANQNFTFKFTCVPKLSNEKIKKDMGITFRPMQESLNITIQNLRNHGWLKVKL